MRSVIYYYRIFAGWPDNVGTIEGAFNDFKTLSQERRQAFQAILKSANDRKVISDVENVVKFLNVTY